MVTETKQRSRTAYPLGEFLIGDKAYGERL